jgi:hypothetical protein
MHFKQWMKLLEAIAPDVKEIILKAKWPASKEEVDKAIKSIEDSPESYDKKQAFSFMQKQFGLKSTEKQTITDPFIQEYKNKEQAKQITTEEFKTLQYFQNGNKELLKEMMDKLRELISTNKITLIFDTKPKIKDSNNEMLDDYKDLNQFLAIIHKFDQIDLSDKDIQNPAFLELKHSGDLVAKGDNIWVFKGDDPIKCRIMGKGQNWCISSSTSVQHYFNYRHDYGQTQYFIFDFNKDVKDPARYVNPGVAPEGEYSEWVDRRNAPSKDTNGVAFAVNGYPTLQDYLKYLQSKGIDTNLFQADEITDYERDLRDLLNRHDFQGAKNYPDTKKTADGTPFMLYYYLKIINVLDDEDEFDLLTPTQKDEWVIGKDKLTGHQANYVISKGTKFLKEYINSINFFRDFLENLQKPDPIIDFIIENKKDLTDVFLKYFLDNSKDPIKKIELIVNRAKKENASTQNNIFQELIYSLTAESIGYEEQIEIVKAIAENKPNFFGNEIDDIIGRMGDLDLEKRIDVIQTIVEKLKKYNGETIAQIFDMLLKSGPKSQKEKYEKVISTIIQNITNTDSRSSPSSNIIVLLMKIHQYFADYTIKQLGEKINLINPHDVVYAFKDIDETNILKTIIPQHIINQLNEEQVISIIDHFIQKSLKWNIKTILDTIGTEPLQKISKDNMQQLLQKDTRIKPVIIEKIKEMFPNNNYPNSWKEIEGLQ